VKLSELKNLYLIRKLIKFPPFLNSFLKGRLNYIYIFRYVWYKSLEIKRENNGSSKMKKNIVLLN
jgi:hypothetical protein